MVGIVLLGHGHVATGLASALKMVAGKQEAFEAIDLIEADAAVYASSVDSAIASLVKQCDGVIVLCDLLGGTPFNCVMITAAKFDKVEVIAGVNLAMLIECVFNRTSADLTSLCTLVLSAGVSGIVNETLKDRSSSDKDMAQQGDGSQSVVLTGDAYCVSQKGRVDCVSEASEYPEEQDGI